MRFDENFNVSLSLNPKREMIKVMKKYLLASLLALLAFVGKAQEDNSDIVKVGDTMPSFTIVSDNGSKLQSASLKGKVILVNFSPLGVLLAKRIGRCPTNPLAEIQEQQGLRSLGDRA